MEWLRTLAASGVSVCWMVLSPALISGVRLNEAPPQKKRKKEISTYFSLFVLSYRSRGFKFEVGILGLWD